jgi:Bacterial extracellular solute-binding protein
MTFLTSASFSQTVDHTRHFLMPTSCVSEPEYSSGDPDVVRKGPRTTVNVMFHGNRFVAARDLASAFEKMYPNEVVSYTAIPPSNTLKALESNGREAGSAGLFEPDVVMGLEFWGELKKNSVKRLTPYGKYSDIHGMVMIARKDDKRISNTDWSGNIKNKSIKIVLPGVQSPHHALVAIYSDVLGPEGIEGLKNNPRVGATQIRHHRSMPARIKGGCEDAGIQFLQSKRYLEKTEPGVFQFIPVPISEKLRRSEASYVYTVNGAGHAKSAELFAKFMLSKTAQTILKDYSLGPL